MKFKVNDIIISKANDNLYMIKSINYDANNYNLLFIGTLYNEKEFIHINQDYESHIELIDRVCRKYSDKEVNQLYKMITFQ